MSCSVIVNVNVHDGHEPPDPDALASTISEAVPGAEVTVHVATFTSNVVVDEEATT